MKNPTRALVVESPAEMGDADVAVDVLAVRDNAVGSVAAGAVAGQQLVLALGLGARVALPRPRAPRSGRDDPQRLRAHHARHQRVQDLLGHLDHFPGDRGENEIL